VVHSYEELVALIYDAAVEPSSWPVVLEHFSDFVEGAGAKLTLQDSELGRNEVISVRMGPDADRLYAQHYHKINILMPCIKQQPAGAVVLHQQLIDHDVLVRSQYYNEFLKPGDFCSGIGVVVAKEREFWAIASCGRASSADRFGSEQVKRAKSLAPHLSRAAMINFRLSRARIDSASYVEALNNLRQGVLIVADGLRVLFANIAAERILQDGQGLTVKNGILQTRSAAETSYLYGAIAGAIGGRRTIPSGTTLAVARGAERRPLAIAVIPLGADTAWARDLPAALLFVGDPEVTNASTHDQLRALYDLTPTEARVALAAGRGKGLQAIANKLGIGLTTARTHLQRVFGKTGTARQAELVRLIDDSSPGARNAMPHE
jgi:DNA-binding CsgD family transcriptional regulator